MTRPANVTNFVPLSLRIPGYNCLPTRCPVIPSDPVFALGGLRTHYLKLVGMAFLGKKFGVIQTQIDQPVVSKGSSRQAGIESIKNCTSLSYIMRIKQVGPTSGKARYLRKVLKVVH
jgi:hypothetical protein